MKTKTGEDKFVAQQKGDYERIKAKALAGDKDALAKFHTMKDRGQDIATKLSERLGYERVLRTQGATRAIAEAKFRRANGRAQTCSETVAGSWNCVGTQYRKKKADGKWTEWGQPWNADLSTQIRDAEETYYGANADMAEYRRRQAIIRRYGYRRAAQMFANEEARLDKDESTARDKKIAEAKKKGKKGEKGGNQWADKKIAPTIKKAKILSKKMLDKKFDEPPKKGETIEQKLRRPTTNPTNTFNRLKENQRQNDKYGKVENQPRRNKEQLPKQENPRERFKSLGNSYLDLVRDPAK